MTKRAQVWLKNLGIPAPGFSGEAMWKVCDQTDRDAVLFVQANSGHGFEKYGELKKVANLTPWDVRDFFENEERWDAAPWEAKAQYYEFMADATRMFAPKE